MKLIGVNRWLSLLANLGVLAGIVLVAYELAQNRALMEAQTRNEVSVQVVDLMRDVSTDPGLANLLRRAASGDPLSEDEVVQYLNRKLAMLRYFENVHYQFRRGLYDEVEFLRQQEAWRNWIRRGGPAQQQVWCDWRETFSPDFRLAFDSLHGSLTC
jgi:hypothetical protein